MEKLIAKKGYTIEVTSWENDGDNYATKSMTVEDKDYALAILQMCKDIFVSCNNGDGGIGNMNDYRDNSSDIILNYTSDNPLINKGETNPSYIIDNVMDINYQLMGSSENYYSRVFERGCIYYSPENVYLEEISN